MKTLIDVFEKFNTRNQTAMVYRTGIRRFIYSYKDLDKMGRQMARWFSEQGVSKGDRVVVWAPNSPWWAVVYWGIMLRGAVIVPVDFVSTKDRVQKITELTDAKLVIQSQYKFDKFISSSVKNLNIEDLEYLIESRDSNIEIEKISPDDLAEIVYTSGTTGDPKGVMLSHKNLLTNVVQASEHIKIGSGFTFLSLLPLSHLFEQTGGFMYPLYVGGSIVYLRTIKPTEILQAFKKENIYVSVLVPRLLQLLKTSIERELAEKHLQKIFNFLIKSFANSSKGVKKIIFFPIHKKFGKNFQFFVSGGAPLDLHTARFWKNIGFTILEGYGLSECSPTLTLNTLDSQVIGAVGKLLPGVQIKIKNNEVLAKGENIFSGYYHNEVATKSAIDKEGWFHTGDFGYFDSDKNLVIKGRSKDLIVTSAGINVHPEDIENVLHQITEVKEACVLGVNMGSGEEIHAVVILKNKSNSLENIIQKANNHLDPLQQITSYSLWPEMDFPKTATLKIQKFKVRQTVEGKEAKVQDEISNDTLINLIAKVTGKKHQEVKEDSILVQNLGLTSISRLELVNYIELEYRMDLDDSMITNQTRVSDLRLLIRNREKYKIQSRIVSWTNDKWTKGVRKFTDFLIFEPVFKHYIDLKVEGLENIKKINQPVIFIANHLSYADQPCVFFALPKTWRTNMATAAWEEFFFPENATLSTRIMRRIFFFYSSLMLNFFPLSQTKGFRGSLSYMGQVIDKKINILIFPEGERSRTLQMLPFMQGIGLIVKELKIPVVPIKLLGVEKVLRRGESWIKKGKVLVKFGEPLIFKNESASDIVKLCKEAIERL